MSNTKTRKTKKESTDDHNLSQKPKTTKSRNGCVTCKKRRLKCDETKPLCKNCIKKGIVCGGYAINFKWRDFSETSNSQKVTTANINTNAQSNSIETNLEHQTLNLSNTITSSKKQTTNTESFGKKRQNSGDNSKNVLERALEDATRSVTGKSTQEISIANVLMANGKNPELAAAIAHSLTKIENQKDINNLLNADNFTQIIKKTRKESPTFETSNTTNFEKARDNVDIVESESSDKLLHEEKMKVLSTGNNLLHSLADVAAKAQASPNVPLSPFNELFSDSFLQIHNANNRVRVTYPNISKFENTKQDEKTKKMSSPLNLYKDLPSSALSPPIFPKSPNISNLLLYSNTNTFSNESSNIASSETPKFEEVESYSPFPQYLKFSPAAPDLYNNNNTESLQDLNINQLSQKIQNPLVVSDNTKPTETPKFSQNSPLLQNHPTPPFLNMLTTMNSDLSTPAIVTSTTPNPSQTSNGIGSLYNIETPRIVGQSNPASPFSSLLNYNNINAQLSKDHLINTPQDKNYKISSLSKIQELGNENKNSDDCRRVSVSSIGSVDSADSNLSSTLDIIGFRNQKQTVVQNTPINLYSLHLPDEHLSTLIAFDRHTCGIMSIRNGPTENPWRTFLLPMSVDHPVIRSALLAMTCFHVARGDPNLRARGVKYMKDAIISLVNGLSTDSPKDQKRLRSSSSSPPEVAASKDLVKKTPPDVALATCIALAMGEAWDRHISTGIAHLKGAKSMIIRVLNKLEGKKKHKKRKFESTSRSNSFSSNVSGYSSLDNDNEYDDDISNKKVPKELQFLVNAWMYFDVLARMTSENDEETDNEDDNDMSKEAEKEEEQEEEQEERLVDEGDQVDRDKDSVHTRKRKAASQNLSNSSLKRSLSSSFLLSKKTDSKTTSKETNSASVIAKFRSFNLEDGDTIDPLLGVAQTLFPIMGKVATLISQVRRAKASSSKFNAKSPFEKNLSKTPLRLISKAVELKFELEHWKLPSLPRIATSFKSEDPTFDLNAAVATAEAYRYSVLLYLHQTVPEVPSPTSHSLAENAMMLLASVPSSSRTLVTHMFPLFIASCEARPGEEREWARERWNELIDKMWIGTIERAWEVVKEVWSRKDALNGKRRSKLRKQDVNSSECAILSDEENSEPEYNKVKRRISVVIHGDDEDLIVDEDNNIGSWTHWTTVMKEWGWEVLLA